MISNIKIKDAYTLAFTYENIEYSIELGEFINYLIDYFTDDHIENSDGICDVIDYYANSYDLIEIIRLVQGLDANDITNYEYFIVDCAYYYVTPFNDFYDLSEVYDLAEVLEEFCDDPDNLEYYCNKV